MQSVAETCKVKSPCEAVNPECCVATTTVLKSTTKLIVIGNQLFVCMFVCMFVEV